VEVHPIVEVEVEDGMAEAEEEEEAADVEDLEDLGETEVVVQHPPVGSFVRRMYRSRAEAFFLTLLLLSSSSLVVKTNCFQAKYSAQSQDTVWHMYRIEITPKRHVKDADTRDGVLPPFEKIPDCHPEKAERFQNSILQMGSTSLTRLILLNLSKLLIRDNLIVAVRPPKTA
jgi:hypothetical protein